MSFLRLKNGQLVARLKPAKEKRCTGRELADALSEVRLSPEEARAWYRDLQSARQKLKRPADKVI